MRIEQPTQDAPKLERLFGKPDTVLMENGTIDTHDLSGNYKNPLLHRFGSRFPVRLVSFEVDGQRISLYNGDASHSSTRRTEAVVHKLPREEAHRLKQVQEGLKTVISQASDEEKAALLQALGAFQEDKNLTFIYYPHGSARQFYTSGYSNGKKHHQIDLFNFEPQSMTHLREIIESRQVDARSVWERLSKPPEPPQAPTKPTGTGLGRVVAELIVNHFSRPPSIGIESGNAKPKPKLPSFGKNRREIGSSILDEYEEDTSSARIEDYIGEEKLIKQMGHIIASLKDPELYYKKGFPVERKLLLAGPPGTGKTLFAKTIAHELGAPLYKPTFSRAGSPYQSLAGNKMNEILDAIEAKAKEGPVGLLIDELDGMGSSGDVYHISDSTKGMRDALLTRIEEMSPNIIIIGTTNKPNEIDPALQRPGRFGKPIIVPPFTSVDVKEAALGVFMERKAKEFGQDASYYFSPDIDKTAVAAHLPKEITGAEVGKVIACAMERRGERLLEKSEEIRDFVTTEDMLAAIQDTFPDTNTKGAFGFGKQN